MGSRVAGGVMVVGSLTLALLSTVLAQAPAAAAAARKPAARRAAAKVTDPAAFLVKPAQQALAKRDHALAVSLYRGIVAIRGEGDETVWDLAKAWQLAGQFDAAAEELERYRDAVTDAEAKKKAAEQIAELRQRGDSGFGAADFRPRPAVREATEAFKRGRRAFAGKSYEEAILYYKAGYAMAPDMPGNLRELGAAYDKLGRTAEAEQFFTHYLTMRPFGKNADEVRKRLVKAGLTAKIDVESSLPCDLVMVNRQVVPDKLPIKGLVVAPGYYKWLCYSPRYHLAWFESVQVDKGEDGKVTFAWAVIENKLDPWGRIVLENPRRPDQMNDVGLFDEIGVPVPADRRALKVQLRAGDGSKYDERFIKLEPGQRYALEW